MQIITVPIYLVLLFLFVKECIKAMSNKSKISTNQNLTKASAQNQKAIEEGIIMPALSYTSTDLFYDEKTHNYHETKQAVKQKVIDRRDMPYG